MDPGPGGTGMSLQSLKQQCPKLPALNNCRDKNNVVDLEKYMVEDWNVKETGPYSFAFVDYRVQFVKGLLKMCAAGNRNKRIEVIVVSHSGFLMRLVGGMSYNLTSSKRLQVSNSLTCSQIQRC